MITVSTMKYHNNVLSDIDECATREDSCSANGVCSNVEGSYKCGCKPGYSGDGRTCEGTVIKLTAKFFLYRYIVCEIKITLPTT